MIWRISSRANVCSKPNIWLVGLSDSEYCSSFKMRPYLIGLAWLLGNLVGGSISLSFSALLSDSETPHNGARGGINFTKANFA